MRYTEKPEDLKRWDYFRFFHWGVKPSGFTPTTSYDGCSAALFEDDSFAWRMAEPGPDFRRVYGFLNFRIVGTKDAELPTLRIPDGDVVPVPWYGTTQQILFIDFDTRRAVATSGPRRQFDAIPEDLPEGVKTAFTKFTHRNQPTRYQAPPVIITKPGANPIGNPIEIYAPWTKAFGKEERAHIRKIEREAKTYVEVMQETSTKTPVLSGGLDPARMVAVNAAIELEPYERVHIHRHGIGRRVTRVPYLELVD